MDIEAVENKIRNTVLAKRIRISEYFGDYDKLHSGYITRSQFLRCLDQTVGVRLTLEESDALFRKYDLKCNGTISYRHFVDNIDKPFKPNEIDKDPSLQEVKAPEIRNDIKPESDPDKMKCFETIMKQLCAYYKYHGTDISPPFQDLDKLNSGTVTESQFYRSIIRPTGLSDEMVSMIASHYAVPEKPGFINYINFCNDVHNRTKSMEPDAPTGPTIPYGFWPPELPKSPEILEVFDKIRDVVFLKGIRTPEFFKDYDKLHSGLVTESQFVRGLHLICGREGILTEQDIQILLRCFGTPDGKVRYRDFCDVMEHAYNIPHLEKYPRAEVYKPPSGSLFKLGTKLTDEEEKRLETLLRELCDKVDKRQLLVNPFFRDYDEFERTLDYLGLSVLPMDFRLLCKRFGDPASGDINYVAFSQAVDKGLPSASKAPEKIIQVHPRYKELQMLVYKKSHKVLGFLQSMEVSTSVRSSTDSVTDSLNTWARSLLPIPIRNFLSWAYLHCQSETTHKPEEQHFIFHLGSLQPNDFTGFRVDSFEAELPAIKPIEISPEEQEVGFKQEKKTESGELDLGELMARLRHHILVNRVRTVDFIEDFDPLRSGRIPTSVFRRVLGLIGFDPDLNDAQFSALANCYEDPFKPGHIIWTNFTKDIDSVFTMPELEKTPTVKVPPSESYLLPKVGTVDADILNAPERTQFESLMCRLKERISHRSLITHPVFNDFDKENKGHLSRSQFHRSLALLNIEVPENEVDLLEKVFSDELGVNYVRFLDQVDPQPKPEEMYDKLMDEIQQLNDFKGIHELGASNDINCILEKIKTKVYRNRVRIGDHMKDFDKLNSGRILKNNFRRALNLDGFELQPSEMAILEKAYESCKEPDYVDYKVFINEIESIFTLDHLEKCPQTEVIEYKPPADWTLNTLSAEEICVYEDAMKRLADKVMFCNTGSVTNTSNQIYMSHCQRREAFARCFDVGKKRVQLFPLFEDFDRLKIGSVSQPQFHRVLAELVLDNVLSPRDIRVLMKRFRVKIGTDDDVNYNAFCDAVYDAANMDKRMP